MEIRSLRTQDDFKACVKLQHLTWGPDYSDIVPASLLMVSEKIAGIVAGAFLPSGELAAFVYGLTGIEAGRLLHWSHMLAVRDDLRNRGIGRKLKRYQADRMRSLGVEEMRWTFDPLVARNAHLNLCHLKVKVKEYVPEMYGDTGSGLHSFGTDRFVVSWKLDSASTDDRQSAKSDGYSPGDDWGEERAFGEERSTDDASRAPLVLQPGKDGTPPAENDPLPDASSVRLPVPHDIQALWRASPKDAEAWRRATRRALVHYQESGYEVAGFRSRGPGGPSYLLRLRETA